MRVELAYLVHAKGSCQKRPLSLRARRWQIEPALRTTTPSKRKAGALIS